MRAPRCLATCAVDSKDALQKLWPRMCTEVLGTTLLMCHRFWKLEVDWSLWIRCSLQDCHTSTARPPRALAPLRGCNSRTCPLCWMHSLALGPRATGPTDNEATALECTVVALDCRRKEMPMPSNLSCTSSAFIALEETPHPLHSRHNKPGCTRRNP